MFLPPGSRLAAVPNSEDHVVLPWRSMGRSSSVAAEFDRIEAALSPAASSARALHEAVETPIANRVTDSRDLGKLREELSQVEATLAATGKRLAEIRAILEE